MNRLWLNVPYDEKGQAKKLDAGCDPAIEVICR